MTRIYLFAFLNLLVIIGYSQQQDSLMQLNKPKTILDNYLNFDVPKLMIGQGFASGREINIGANLSIKGQFLWPYALSKRHLKIAYGATFGSSKITSRHTELRFQNSELLAIQTNKDVKKTMIRTGYVGIIVMRVFRWKKFTLMTGPSLEYNMCCKIKEKTDKGTNTFSGKKYINKFSVPINVQLSISRKQFFACGFFGSYDFVSRFKGNDFKQIKQVVIGVSGSLIL